jgi:uncharacterized protein YciI
MPTFVVTYDYLPDSSEARDAEMVLHRQWLSDRAARGELLAAGSFADALGAHLLFRAASWRALEKDIATDPFVSSGLILRTVVREWNPKFGTLVDELNSDC